MTEKQFKEHYLKILNSSSIEDVERREKIYVLKFKLWQILTAFLLGSLLKSLCLSLLISILKKTMKKWQSDCKRRQVS